MFDDQARDSGKYFCWRVWGANSGGSIVEKVAMEIRFACAAPRVTN